MNPSVFVYPFNSSGGHSDVDKFFEGATFYSKYRLTTSAITKIVWFFNLPPLGWNRDIDIQVLTHLYNINDIDGYGEDLNSFLSKEWCLNSNEALIKSTERAKNLFVTSNYWKRKFEEKGIYPRLFKMGVNLNVWKVFPSTVEEFCKEYYTFFESSRPANGLKTFVEVAYKLPDLKFLAFGSGCDPITLKRRFNMDTPPNLLFKGWVGNLRATIQLFQRSKALIFPSLEIFSMKVLSAMACNVLPIVFKDSPSEDFVDDSVNGWLVGENSVDAIVEKINMIESLNEDKLAAMRKKVRPSLVKKGYDLFSSVRFMDNIIDFIMRGKK